MRRRGHDTIARGRFASQPSHRTLRSASANPDGRDETGWVNAMKLHYAPQSPFARKVRAAAIELGLGERLKLEYTKVVPGRANTSYATSGNPLRKIPALVTDEGETIFDSTVICESISV